MKKAITLALVLFSLTCSAQSYISANTDIILESGAVVKYASPNIFVTGTYQVRSSLWMVVIRVTSGATANEPVVAEFTTVFTKAAIDAYTGTGTGDTAKAQNAIEQAVGGYLGALNVSTTFTIH
jgi:hypothetical protein